MNLCSSFFVLRSSFLVLGTWFLVLGSWFLVLGSWFLVLGWGALFFVEKVDGYGLFLGLLMRYRMKPPIFACVAVANSYVASNSSLVT